MSDKKTKFIVICDERLWKSMATDAVSTVSLISSVLVGVYIGSDALQWIGGIIWILWILARLGNVNSGHMTIDEARKKLDELEAHND